MTTIAETAKRAAVAREAEQHMNRLADHLGDLGDDARRWAQLYAELANRAQDRCAVSPTCPN